MKEELNIKAPNLPSEITVEWLNNVLASEISGAKIISMEIDQNFGPESLLGKAVRLNLQLSDKESQLHSVIVKFQVHTSGPEKEGQIYQLLSADKVPYIPKLHAIFGNGNLIIEDLSPDHSTIEETTIEQAKNVLSKLADLNSRFWEDDRVPIYDRLHFINSININFDQSWERFQKRYKEQLGNEENTFKWMQQNPEQIADLYNSGPINLSHGDVNRDNILFPKDDSNDPVLIDWQLAGHKILGFDPSYYIVNTLTVEQRHEHEQALLKEYYQQLPEQIQATYSFDRLFLAYRACITRSMLSAVTRIGPKFDDFTYRDNDADELTTRVLQAMRDHQPIEAIEELEKNKWLTK